MGSETLKLPIIDFSKQDLKPGTPGWVSLSFQVRESLEEFGCFEAIYDKIPLQIRKALLSSIEEFFELPLETKQGITLNGQTRGYTGKSPLIPLFQNVSIDDAQISDNLETFTNEAWPLGNQNFSNTMKSYAGQLIEFERTVKRMIVEALGLDKYMDEFMNPAKYSYRLRLIKYDGPGTPEKQVGTITHTDKNIMTILYQNHVEGFEVKTKDGQWITYKPSSLDSFHVVLGDTLHAWTNGRLYCPSHRVMSSGNEARYAAGLFCALKAGYIVKAPEELIDEEHPQLYKAFDYGQYLEYYYASPVERVDFPLPSFCGV